MITLEITFRGLCLFVPDEERRCMHVLIPASGGHAPGDPPPAPRDVRLRFPGDGEAGLPMEGWALELGSGTEGTADTRFPGEMPDLATLLGARTNPRLLGDDPGPSVAARITLHTGRITRFDPGALSRPPGKEGADPMEVTWTIDDLPDGPLDWRRTRLNAGPHPQEPLPPLAPGDDGVIRIAVGAAARESEVDRYRMGDQDTYFVAGYGYSGRAGLRDKLRHEVVELPELEGLPRYNADSVREVAEKLKEGGTFREEGVPRDEPSSHTPSRSTPVAEAAPPADEPVYLSGAAPRRVRPGDYFTAELAAYVKAYERQVAETMGRDYRPDEIQTGTPAAGPWPSGAKVTVRIHTPGLVVDEAEQSFTWQSTYCHMEFDVGVPEDAPERRTVIRFEAYIDAVRVGKVSLNLEVSRAAAPGEEKVSAGAQGARKAFVSYSHEDQAEVLKAVGLLSPVLRDSEFFVDLVSLRTGGKWEPALEAAIRDCNLFLLFWSSNAQKSEWVTREWTYALDHHGDDVLQVLLLERVDPKTVPERLSGFQFDSHWLRLAEQVEPG